MFPTEFANCAAKVQQNSLNLWPLWRRIPAWAVLTANFTNHTDFFAHTTFKSDSNWVTFAPKPSGKQGLLLRGSEGLALSRASALKYCTCTYTNMQSPSRKRCILDLFSLGVSLAAINVTAHPARVHMCKRTSFLLHLTPIYIHPHFHTHATHYFQCAISPSNYRKIHCPLMSVACRGKYSCWAARECVWTTESLPRDVNHCLSQGHLHQTAHQPLLQRAVLRDNGKKDYKWLETTSRGKTIKQIGKRKGWFYVLEC